MIRGWALLLLLLPGLALAAPIRTVGFDNGIRTAPLPAGGVGGGALIGFESFPAAGATNLPGGCLAPTHLQTTIISPGAWVANASCAVDLPTNAFAATYVPPDIATRTIASLSAVAVGLNGSASECQLTIFYRLPGGSRTALLPALVVNPNGGTLNPGEGVIESSYSLELPGGSWYHVQADAAPGGTCTATTLQLTIQFEDTGL